MQELGFILNDEVHSMKRRSIVSLSGAAMLGAALPAFAQTQRVMRIGFLGEYPPSTYPASSQVLAWAKAMQ